MLTPAYAYGYDQVAASTAQTNLLQFLRAGRTVTQRDKHHGDDPMSSMLHDTGAVALLGLRLHNGAFVACCGSAAFRVSGKWLGWVSSRHVIRGGRILPQYILTFM